MKTLSFKVGLLVLVMAVSCTDTEIPKESQKISKEDIEKTLVEMGFDKDEITFYDDKASAKGKAVHCSLRILLNFWAVIR
jgi:hypothetical protein